MSMCGGKAVRLHKILRPNSLSQDGAVTAFSAHNPEIASSIHGRGREFFLWKAVKNVIGSNRRLDHCVLFGQIKAFCKVRIAYISNISNF